MEAITCEQEERLRLGYDMQTAVQFAVRDHHLRYSRREYALAGERIIALDYAPAATVRRMNLGWRRRKAQGVYGFCINTENGIWSRDDQNPDQDDNNDIDNSDKALVDRITPYVQDKRNLLILRPRETFDTSTMATLMYALKRGIEKLYQIEEAELAVEPLPHRNDRRTLLFYEAAEGGAGILSQIVSRPEALAEVARTALEVAHYQIEDGIWKDQAADHCGAACYKCLLSYYNQPDNKIINRRDERFKDFLEQLSQVQAEELHHGEAVGDLPAQLSRDLSETGRRWLTVLEQRGLRLPDQRADGEARYGGALFRYGRGQALIFLDKAPDLDQLDHLEGSGLPTHLLRHRSSRLG